MSYSKLIHEYLDGELSSVEQDVLFNELAHDHDLRFEFNQQVKLQIIAQSDMGTITPPAASTNAIFAALGFAIPSKEYVQSISGKDAAGANFGYSNFLRRIFARYAGTITAILIAVLSTATVFIVSDNFFGSSSDNSGSAGNGNNSGKTKISGKSSIPNSSIPLVSSVASDENSSGTQTGSENGTQTENENGINRRYDPLQSSANTDRGSFTSDSRRNRADNSVTVYGRNFGRNANAGRNSRSGRNANSAIDNSNEGQSNIQPLSLASTADIVNSNGEASQRFASRFSNFPVSPAGTVMLNLSYPETSLPSFKERDWMLSARYLPSNSSIRVNLPSKSLSLGFSLMYELGAHNMLGLEIGEENFGLKYSVNKGERLNEKMSPPLLCYGLTWRVNMTELGYEDIIFPYAQIFAGGTSVGPLGRAQLGLQFNPFGMLALSLGIEGSSLWYNVQDNIYHTEKYGITVGGGFRF